jgi:hypothetical protein
MGRRVGQDLQYRRSRRTHRVACARTTGSKPRRRTARVVNGVVGLVLFALGLGLAYEA